MEPLAREAATWSYSNRCRAGLSPTITGLFITFTFIITNKKPAGSAFQDSLMFTFLLWPTSVAHLPKAHSGIFIECTALDSSAPSITIVPAMVNIQLRQESVPGHPPFDACGPPMVSVLHLIQLPCLLKCDLPL